MLMAGAMLAMGCTQVRGRRTGVAVGLDHRSGSPEGFGESEERLRAWCNPIRLTGAHSTATGVRGLH